MNFTVDQLVGPNRTVVEGHICNVPALLDKSKFNTEYWKKVFDNTFSKEIPGVSLGDEIQVTSPVSLAKAYYSIVHGQEPGYMWLNVLYALHLLNDMTGFTVLADKSHRMILNRINNPLNIITSEEIKNPTTIPYSKFEKMVQMVSHYDYVDSKTMDSIRSIFGVKGIGTYLYTNVLPKNCTGCDKYIVDMINAARMGIYN